MLLRDTFKNNRGERLSALIDLPTQASPFGFAIFAHCFTCTKDIHAAYHIAHTLLDENIGVMRFDFTGLGESEGRFGQTSFSTNVEDLLAAARFLSEKFRAPELLIGHSFGGAAAIEAAVMLKSVRAVVTIGAPFGPQHVMKHLTHVRPVIDEKGEARVTLSGKSVTITQSFVDDLENYSFEQTLKSLNSALMVIHSPLDTVVDIENAHLIFQHARHPKSFISLDESDHLLSQKRDARFVGHLIAAWSKRYLAPE